MQPFWNRRRAAQRMATPKRNAKVIPIGSLTTVAPINCVRQLDLVDAIEMRSTLPPFPRAKA